MADYRLHLHLHLHLRHADTVTVDALLHLDELAERVALEQLLHELNPVEPDGYVVTFMAVGPDGHAVAAGHFYVRAPAGVAPTTGSRNSCS